MNCKHPLYSAQSLLYKISHVDLISLCKILDVPHFTESQLRSKKNAWLFQPNLGSNMDKPRHWVKFLHDIFNPTFGFVHI